MAIQEVINIISHITSYWRMPVSSQNNCLLDAGRYGLSVLTRHFPHPVGRFHQHDDEDTYSEVPKVFYVHLLVSGLRQNDGIM